jgi:VanZ family protein
MNSPPETWPLFRPLVWLLFCAAACVVLYYTFRPGPGGTMFMWRDKFQHLGAYGTLSFLATLGAGGRRQAILIVASLALAGYVMELLQPLVGRSYDLLDEAANIAGCIVGFTLARLLIRMWHAARPA